MSDSRFRRWLRVSLAALPVLVVLLWSDQALAYPWMLRHGFAQCGSCHTDPMGGETLTGFGRAIGDSKLSTQYDGDDTPTSAGQLFYGVEEPDWGRFGGSIRWLSMYRAARDDQPSDFTTFPMQIDAYGQLRFDRLRLAGSIGIAKVREGSVHARPAFLTSGEGDALNLLSRNHWVGYDVADGWLVRAGRINLPFGVRIPEHVMWVREGTRTDRESDQHHGVALSYAKGRWRGELMGIAGNYQIRPDEFRERGYSLHAEYMLDPRLALGISSLVTHAARDRLVLTEDLTRQAHGVTARVVPHRDVALLAEVDLLASSRTSLGYVSFVQADYELVSGLHLLGTLESRDEGALDGLPARPGQGEMAMGGWLSVNWFFVTHFDFRFDAVFRQDNPVTLLAQGHFYF
jgi:hypothetical protein